MKSTSSRRKEMLPLAQHQDCQPSRIHDVRAEIFELTCNFLLVADQPLLQSLELGPVGIQADAE
jgi:hypothetical protein